VIDILCQVDMMGVVVLKQFYYIFCSDERSNWLEMCRDMYLVKLRILKLVWIVSIFSRVCKLVCSMCLLPACRFAGCRLYASYHVCFAVKL